MADNQITSQNVTPQPQVAQAPTVIVNTVPQRFQWGKLKSPLFNLLFIAAIGFGVYKQFYDPDHRGSVTIDPKTSGTVQIDISQFKSFNKCYSESIKQCQCATDVANQCSGVKP